MKPIHRRPAAIEDMISQVAYRRNAAGEASAATLVDEMQECLTAISEAPAIGSRQIGKLLGVSDLQWKRVGKTKLWLIVEPARGCLCHPEYYELHSSRRANVSNG